MAHSKIKIWVDRSGSRFNPDLPRTVLDVQYPANTLLNYEEPVAYLGLREIEIEDPRPADYSDTTYYRTEQDTAPYIVYSRKSAEQLQQHTQSQINKQSSTYLSDTDWYVTRFIETGIPVPAEVTEKRQNARDSIQKLNTGA